MLGAAIVGNVLHPNNLVMPLYVRRMRVRFPMGSLGFFYCLNTSGRTMALGSTRPLTKMRTGDFSWGVKVACV
jgi:hypothetical protein